MGNDNGLAVEGIIDIGQSRIGKGWKADRPRPGTSCPGFVRTFLVEDFDKVVEPGLLVKQKPEGVIVAKAYGIQTWQNNRQRSSCLPQIDHRKTWSVRQDLC